MKKHFLTAMLFFAFMFVGIQSTSAQMESDGIISSAQYVGTAEATNILAYEINSLHNNPIIFNEVKTDSQFSYLERKLNFYTAVHEGIAIGNSIPDAIMEGEQEANDIDDDQVEGFDSYVMEIIQLLSQ